MSAVESSFLEDGINVTRGGRGGRNWGPHLRAALGLRARAPSFVSVTHGQNL